MQTIETGVPASASAVAANLTMIRPDGPAFVTAFPGGPVPTVSNVNASAAGQVRAALGFVRSDAGRFDVVAGAAGTDLAVDVFGWFE